MTSPEDESISFGDVGITVVANNVIRIHAGQKVMQRGSNVSSDAHDAHTLLPYDLSRNSPVDEKRKHQQFRKDVHHLRREHTLSGEGGGAAKVHRCVSQPFQQPEPQFHVKWTKPKMRPMHLQLRIMIAASVHCGPAALA